MVIILFTTFVALLVSMVALLTYEARAYRDFLINDLTTQADILALNSAPALAFNDPEAAEANLALLANRAGISAAAIFTNDGRLFASYQESGRRVEFPENVQLRDPEVAGDAMSLLYPVSRNDEQLGTLYLQADYELAGRIADYLMILGATMSLSLLVATLLSVWLQGTVTAPIRTVTSIAQKIVKDRNFRLRATRTTDDEIGTLVDAFNAMLHEVGQRQHDLEESNRKLKQESDERRNAEAALRLADRRKDEFLATLAHELRNPLAPMVNALTLLDSTRTPPETAVQARAIVARQLSHMVRLVEDLLDVSRISQGKLAVRKELVELGSILNNAVDTVRPLLAAKEQSLTLSLPDNAVHLQGDTVRLSQVFSNLLNNASKYTPACGHVSLNASVENGSAVVTIVDDGKGISASTLPVMFEMFVQDAEVDIRAQPGLGVGLALARRLVELHGGTIEAASAGCGQGSRFTVRMPVDEAPASVAAEQERRPNPDYTRYRILLVDDNVDFANSLGVLLRSLGHTVEVTHDAPEALAAAGVFQPDFAFLDIGLPTMDGYELARKLTDSRLNGLKLVAISGWGQKEDRRRADDAGFGWYLVKPVELASIQAILESTPVSRADQRSGSLADIRQ
jgi:signal transduction histidine kinase/CheY-like chemotaxis protein